MSAQRGRNLIPRRRHKATPDKKHRKMRSVSPVGPQEHMSMARHAGPRSCAPAGWSTSPRAFPGPSSAGGTRGTLACPGRGAARFACGLARRAQGSSQRGRRARGPDSASRRHGQRAQPGLQRPGPDRPGPDRHGPVSARASGILGPGAFLAVPLALLLCAHAAAEQCSPREHRTTSRGAQEGANGPFTWPRRPVQGPMMAGPARGGVDGGQGFSWLWRKAWKAWRPLQLSAQSSARRSVTGPASRSRDQGPCATTAGRSAKAGARKEPGRTPWESFRAHVASNGEDLESSVLDQGAAGWSGAQNSAWSAENMAGADEALEADDDQAAAADDVAGASLEKDRLWGDAGRVPDPLGGEEFYNPHRVLVQRKPGQRRPCRARNIVIPVFRYEDVLKRARYSSRTTVRLVFQRSFALPQTVGLYANFSCTIMQPAKGKTIALSTSWSWSPAIAIVNANNVLINGISIKFGIQHTSIGCDYPAFGDYRMSQTLTCPGILISRSWGVQLVRASVVGRVDVFRSVFVKLDSLRVTMPLYSYDPAKTGYDIMGIIRVGLSTAGPNVQASGIVISNNEVWGGWELITLFGGAVGVTVRNNYLHHFTFVAVRCGWGVGLAFDCHHNYIAHNYIVNPASWIVKGTYDGNNAGLYTALHWFSPRNVFRCNYVLNTAHCIYLDEVSSGVIVQGGVCINGVHGVKVNGGKWNRVLSVIIVKTDQFRQGLIGYITCHFANVQNLYKDIYARNWEGVRRRFFNTRWLNTQYRWMRAIANPVPSSINGVPCNTPGGWSAQETGKCTGLAYNNHVEVFAYNAERQITAGPWYNGTYTTCEKVPAVTRINRNYWFNITAPAYRKTFINFKQWNLGLRRNSPLLRFRKNFVSCPSTAVGPKRVPLAAYARDYNIRQPALLWGVLTFNATHLLDGGVL